MLYYLMQYLGESIVGVNVLHYITFRAGGAMMTALFISFLLGPWVINMMKRKQGDGQPIRDDGPKKHLAKAGTPTMGGLLILLAITLSTLLWSNLENLFIWIVLLSTFGFSLIGFIDDYLKIKHANHRGISVRVKLIAQFVIAICVVWASSINMPDVLATSIVFPFFKNILIDVGLIAFIMIGVFVIVGSSNAVNLTDGLDGLAIVPCMIVAASFGLIAYLVGHVVFAHYLHLHYVAGTGELSIFCGSLIGAGLGFLWFNAHPAKIFMGDTGSLAIGGALGTIAVITKHEIVLAIIGGLFVLEAVSVIVQVISFKLIGKRVFAMAPLHHHFEQRGWAESTIVIRFWIIAVILALIGLSTLKLR